MTEQTSLVRWSRLGAMAFAWLFTAAVVVQIFLAGLALFDTAERWQAHTDFGYMIGILPLLVLVLALIGRAGGQLIGMSAVMVVLYFVQTSLPNVDPGYLAALHPLVAFALLGMSGQLGARIRALDVAPATQVQPTDVRQAG